jgi:hypothetical protein
MYQFWLNLEQKMPKCTIPIFFGGIFKEFLTFWGIPPQVSVQNMLELPQKFHSPVAPDV